MKDNPLMDAIRGAKLRTGVDWERAVFAILCILGMGALIASVLVLGVFVLHSWEAESLMRCPSWSSSPLSCGWFF